MKKLIINKGKHRKLCIKCKVENYSFKLNGKNYTNQQKPKPPKQNDEWKFNNKVINRKNIFLLFLKQKNLLMKNENENLSNKKKKIACIKLS